MICVTFRMSFDNKELCKIHGTTKWDNVYYCPSPSLLLTPAAFLLLSLPYLIPSLTPCLEFYCFATNSPLGNLV